jgi:type II secretory ATPase GspE/PulE/Tfp pilus assembly ATPase PilB-like protein
MSFIARLKNKKSNSTEGAEASDPFADQSIEKMSHDHENTAESNSQESADTSNGAINDKNGDPDADLISAYDPGSQKTVSINGNIITRPGGIAELKENMRQLLIASTGGEIYFSRSHQNDPHVLSEIKRIETIQGAPKIKHAIDMSTLGELYHRSAKNSFISKTESPRNDQSSMQRALIALVANAASKNASDVHIVANQDRAITKFRVDGVMTYINEMQPQYAFELLSAAFAMADASDPAYQQRQYQGARISSLTTELPGSVQSLRLQFNPLANEGRYLVMRILYSGDGTRTEMADLGYSAEQVRQIATMSARPVGINVISGPTGSGKSTTLKAILEMVIDRRAKGGADVNTITIEDPPEYVIRAAQQMPVVNAKTQEERAEAFTQAIAAGLRSDPDIMMIGEIRDLASADLAVEGALSGHPIYASLHANTAMDILSRLRDLGVDDFKVFDASVFSGLVGQRLLRQICPHCRSSFKNEAEKGHIDELLVERVEKMIEITPKRNDGLDHELFVAGPGCNHCTGGYKGRAVIAEIILPDDTFMDFMKVANKSEARTYWFEQMNGIDLLGSSWIRALEGRVSPIDIENSVSLIDPVKAHQYALKYWCDKMGLFK